MFVLYQLYTTRAVIKTGVTLRYTGWLVAIFLLSYYNHDYLYNRVVFHPLNTANNRGLGFLLRWKTFNILWRYRFFKGFFASTATSHSLTTVMTRKSKKGSRELLIIPYQNNAVFTGPNHSINSQLGLPKITQFHSIERTSGSGRRLRTSLDKALFLGVGEEWHLGGYPEV